MNLHDKAWIVRGSRVCEGTISEFTRGDCSVSEFFINEADAYDRLAETEAADAEHKQLAASEARRRSDDARIKAADLRVKVPA